MMETVWVLIIVSKAYAGAFVATQEFNSKDDCAFAVETIRERVDYEMDDVWCVPKGETGDE